MRTVQRPLLVSVLIVALPLVFSSPGCKKEEPDAKKNSMTAKNLQDAYDLAAKRAHWYAEFAQEATKERHTGAASLFKAIARSEEIRSGRHAELLRTFGVEPAQPAIDTIPIGTSPQTLKMAISCEWLQIRSLYPNLIKSAESEKFPEASKQFSQSQSVDLRHAELFKEAADHLAKFPQKVYTLCSECGFIMDTGKEEECPVCHAKKERFERV